MPWRESPDELARARAERPVVVPGPCGDLFGIFTPPASGAPPAGLCVVFFTRPRSHRNRMWVEGARGLASKGFAAFRFDYHGAGDSGGDSAYLDPNHPYRRDAVAVLRFLRAELGQARFVLCGTCFDARTALSAFGDEGDAIAGLVFIAGPVMEREGVERVSAARKSWSHLVRALRRADNWRALVHADRWRYMARVVGQIVDHSLPGGSARMPEPALSSEFLGNFAALRCSRARALFLYGVDDKEYDSFRVAERRLFVELTPEVRRRLEIEVWPGSVHGFLEMRRQRETVGRALGWIESLHPGAAGTVLGAHHPREASWTSA